MTDTDGQFGWTPDVNGKNVQLIEVGNGEKSLGTVRKTSDGVWHECDASYRLKATFAEHSRDAWSVYLHDKSRKVDLQLDLHRKTVVYADQDRRFDLWKIMSAATQVPFGVSIIDFRDAWNASFPIYESAAGHSIDRTNAPAAAGAMDDFQSSLIMSRQATGDARQFLIQHLADDSVPASPELLRGLAQKFRTVAEKLPMLSSAAKKLVRELEKASADAQKILEHLDVRQTSTEQALDRKRRQIQTYKTEMAEAKKRTEVEIWEALIPGYGLYRGIDAAVAVDQYNDLLAEARKAVNTYNKQLVDLRRQQPKARAERAAIAQVMQAAKAIKHLPIEQATNAAGRLTGIYDAWEGDLDNSADNQTESDPFFRELFGVDDNVSSLIDRIEKILI